MVEYLFMKFILIIVALLIGTLFGLQRGFRKSWKTWQVFVACLLVGISLYLTFAPHIAASPQELVNLSKQNIINSLNVHFLIVDSNDDSMVISSINNPQKTFILSTVFNKLKPGDEAIAVLSFNNANNVFTSKELISINPSMVLPYVPALGENVRILNLHVPCAWIAVLGYLISMIYSIAYLRKQNDFYDNIASSSALIGFIFTILATVTGMIWAKDNWGEFWNWDPRETSIFVLLLIYMAYFALRSALDNKNTKSRFSAVYSVLAFITVPFFIFILPRITIGLHPGSADDGNIGPILSSDESSLNYLKQITFSISFLAWTVFYYLLLNITVRLKYIQQYINRATLSQK